jgi:hypothetical protein
MKIMRKLLKLEMKFQKIILVLRFIMIFFDRD